LKGVALRHTHTKKDLISPLSPSRKESKPIITLKIETKIKTVSFECQIFCMLILYHIYELQTTENNLLSMG
jgi:hypothetical protein